MLYLVKYFSQIQIFNGSKHVVNFSGFLGKSLTRHLNRIWNYFFKGALGSFFLTLTYPLMCVGGSALSLIGALLVPVWLVNHIRYNVKNFNLNFILHSGIVELE